MITTATTFVIGAGASCPYGLPTGPELCKRAKDLKPSSDVYQWILQCSIAPVDLNNFLEDLCSHPASSIDGYLETRQTEPNTQKIGKHVIAALMGDAIREAPMTSQIDFDWLSYIFTRMLEGANDAATFAKGNQNVAFVTFNFDTIVETYFQRSLMNAYRGGAGVGVPRVIHLHGKLPAIPSEPFGPIDHYNRGPHPNWLDWLSKSASAINIIIDEIGEETLREARETIGQAHRVCFLGFAYASPNLKRLALPDELEGQPQPKYAFGSAFGFEIGEQGTIFNRFKGRIQLGNGGQDCRAALRHFPIFD